MNLVILGEAVTKLLADHSAFLDIHSEVPWRTLRAVRNRVAHGYFEINLDLIWEMAKVELPALEKQLLVVRASADAWPPPPDPALPNAGT